MKGVVVKGPTALRDLNEAADYIRRRSGPERAVRFLREADATFRRLAEMPGMGALYQSDDPGLTDLRFCPLSRFRMYLAFYRSIVGGIEVLRVLHGARDLPAILSDELGFEEAGDSSSEEMA